MYVTPGSHFLLYQRTPSYPWIFSARSLPLGRVLSGDVVDECPALHQGKSLGCENMLWEARKGIQEGRSVGSTHNEMRIPLTHLCITMTITDFSRMRLTAPIRQSTVTTPEPRRSGLPECHKLSLFNQFIPMAGCESILTTYKNLQLRVTWESEHDGPSFLP